MSWNNTYSHTLLIAIDQLGAAVFFNRPDLTISTMFVLDGPVRQRFEPEAQ